MATSDLPLDLSVQKRPETSDYRNEINGEVQLLSDDISPVCKFWIRYISKNTEKDQLPRDSSVATWILETMYHQGALKSLLVSVRSGRRVFQQLCGQGRIPFVLYTSLIDMGEVDLAFRVALSKDLWTCVVPLYPNALISKRSRYLALQKAVQQTDWKVVQALGMSTDNRETQHRAFMDLVRYDQPALALEILKPRLAQGQTAISGGGLRSNAITDLDVDAAVVRCLALGQQAMACEFLLYRNCHPPLKLWRALLAACFDAGQPDHLRDWLLRLMDRSRYYPSLYRPLIHFALKAGFCDFVIRLCGSSQVKKCLGMKISAQHNMWSVFQSLVSQGKVRMNRGLVRVLLTTLADSQANDQGRHILADFLEGRVEAILRLFDDVLFLDDYFFNKSDEERHNNLSQWCFSGGFPNLAFIFCLLEGNAQISRQILTDNDSLLNQELLEATGIHVLRMNDIHAFIAWMLRMYKNENDAFDFFFDFDICFGMEFYSEHNNLSTEDLLEACRNNHLRKWAVSVAIKREDWEQLENELSSFPCLKLIDNAIVEAADEAEWDFVENFISQCSQNQELLGQILQQALQNGEVKIAKLVMNKKCLDPCQMTDGKYSHSTLLYTVVTSYNDKSVIEQLVQLCISTGVSTYEWSSHNCQGQLYSCRLVDDDNFFFFTPRRHCGALKEAFSSGEMSLVKLLFESGATSNKELFSLKNDSNLRSYHEQVGRVDFLKFLDEAASVPRSLQSLCRLRVSHLIGCKPGREERAASLPLPSLIKDLVLFKDICSVLQPEHLKT